MPTKPVRKTKRALGIAPIAIVMVLVVAAAVFAWSHMAAKGTAPQQDVTSQDILKGDVEPRRDAYGLEDFTEPDSK